jgi:microcystin degradation protein MlrC
MRIVIAKVFVETNTFSPIPFTLDDFRRYGIYRGEQILTKLRNDHPQINADSRR